MFAIYEDIEEEKFADFFKLANHKISANISAYTVSANKFY